MTHRPKVLGTGRIPNLNLARYVIGGLDTFGEKGGGDCGWTGVFAVVAFGEAGYERGFANVTVAEEDYLLRENEKWSVACRVVYMKNVGDVSLG